MSTDLVKIKLREGDREIEVEGRRSDVDQILERWWDNQDETPADTPQARPDETPADSPGRTGLYRARKAKGLSQEALAELADTTKATVNRLETGKRELTRTWAERFAPHLGFSAKQILFWDECSPHPDNPGTTTK
jgi:DNA-binding XRE family transcriptional regulator